MRLSVLAVVGCTAGGKSALGLELARALGGEIVSVDSMQVYRGMDIGTAKATPAERAEVPHHMIDLVEPDERYSAGRYAEEAAPVIEAIRARDRVPILVGGTGLYLRALLYGLAPAAPADQAFRDALRAAERDEPGRAHGLLRERDPETAGRLAPGDLVRIERALEILHLTGRTMSELSAEHRGGAPRYRTFGVELRPDRAWLEPRVTARTERMWRAGLPEEVRRLLDRGYGDRPPLAAIGYKETAAWLRDEISEEEALRRIVINTLRFAKRQRTWFKKEPAVRSLHPRDLDTDAMLRNVREFLAKAAALDAREAPA